MITAYSDGCINPSHETNQSAVPLTSCSREPIRSPLSQDEKRSLSHFSVTKQIRTVKLESLV